MFGRGSLQKLSPDGILEKVHEVLKYFDPWVSSDLPDVSRNRNLKIIDNNNVNPPNLLPNINIVILLGGL